MLKVTKRRKLAVNWWGWTVSVIVMGCAIGVIVLPPFLELPVRLAVMHALDPFCHQIAERSPQVDGIPLAVCHRCFGVYVGLFLGPWMTLSTRGWHLGASGVLIGFSLIPLAMDWSLDVIGLVTNTPVTRVTTGAVFGVVAGVLIVRSLALKAEPVGGRPPAASWPFRDE